MNNNKTVFEEVADGQDILRIGNIEFPSCAHIGRFNFKGVRPAEAGRRALRW
ncbi:hypothetical protein ACNKHQ_25725 [Shigella flexneri]